MHPPTLELPRGSHSQPKLNGSADSSPAGASAGHKGDQNKSSLVELARETAAPLPVFMRLQHNQQGPSWTLDASVSTVRDSKHGTKATSHSGSRFQDSGLSGFSGFGTGFTGCESVATHDDVSSRFLDALAEVARIHSEELLGAWPRESSVPGALKAHRTSIKDQIRRGGSSQVLVQWRNLGTHRERTSSDSKSTTSPRHFARGPTPERLSEGGNGQAANATEAAASEEFPHCRDTARAGIHLPNLEESQPLQPAVDETPWTALAERSSLQAEDLKRLEKDADTSPSSNEHKFVITQEPATHLKRDSKGSNRSRSSAGSEVSAVASGAVSVVNRWRHLVGTLMYPEEELVLLEADANTSGSASVVADLFRTIEIELHPAWQKPQPLRVRQTSLSSLRDRPSVDSSIISLAVLPDDDLQRGEGELQRFVAHPMSVRVAFLGILSSVFFLLDAVYLPIALIHNRVTPHRLFHDLVCAAFWFFDMVHTFFVGYEDQLCTEMRPQQVVKHYLRTWFAVDVLANFVCMMNLYHQVVGQKPSILLALLNLAHLFRVHRVVVATQLAFTRMASAHTRLMLKVVLLILFIFLTAHQIACGWFALGERHQDETWLSTVEVESFMEKYIASLHWSLTQFTPSTNLIGPTNLPERAFAVMVVSLALVISSGFISHLTSLLNQVRTLGMRQRVEANIMRQYIRERGISRKLSNRIHHYLWKAQNFTGKDFELRLEDVPMFAKMPQRLKVLLNTELFAKYLSRCMPLRAFSKFHISTVWELSACACKERFVRPFEEVFYPGHAAGEVYLVAEGLMRYHMAAGDKSKDQDIEFMKNPLDDYMLSGHLERWIVEPALFLSWEHQGLFAGAAQSRLIVLNVSQAMEYLFSGSSLVIRYLLRMYAIFLLQHLENLSQTSSMPLSDLEPSTEASAALIARTIKTLRLCQSGAVSGALRSSHINGSTTTTGSVNMNGSSVLKAAQQPAQN